ncbi:hypothetical protein T11_9028, partial [Trichinella zimbabwensis]
LTDNVNCNLLFGCIKRLRVSSFMCHKDIDLALAERINFIIGVNATFPELTAKPGSLSIFCPTEVVFREFAVLQSNQQHRCCIRYKIGLNSSKSFVQTRAQLYSQINRLANYFAFSALLRLFCSLFENVNNSSLTFLY